MTEDYFIGGNDTRTEFDRLIDRERMTIFLEDVGDFRADGYRAMQGAEWRPRLPKDNLGWPGYSWEMGTPGPVPWQIPDVVFHALADFWVLPRPQEKVYPTLRAAEDAFAVAWMSIPARRRPDPRKWLLAGADVAFRH